jgi:diadenosine tetraphosphate (Ap4A) HIT family hydrolase
MAMSDKTNPALVCVLCQPLAQDEIQTFGHWRVIANANQNKLGKCMICLKRHAEDIRDLSPDEVQELWAIIRQLTTLLSARFQPDHFNYAFLMNKDRHVHLHVIPRYHSERSFAGLEFQDQDEIVERKLPERIQQHLVATLRAGLPGQVV